MRPDGAVEWEVSMPSRNSAGMGAYRPKASLLLYGRDGTSEEVTLPVAVGRAMRARRKSGELGREVPRSELLGKLSELQRACAKERMLSLLERRDHSRKELSDRLAQDGYPTFAREAALEVGERCGLIDDELFAERFVHAKSAGGWGMGRIERELGRRGVDVSQLAGWPDDFIDAEGEFDRALAAASRKHVREPNAYAKLVRFLMGRGFSYGVAKRAATQTLAE